MVTSRINFPTDQVVEFCKRWQVNEFSLFGSVLRDDFRPDSDVDVLVSFNPAAPWSLFDLVTMQDELQKIFGRPVDLVEREGLRNPFRKRSILSSREVIYAAPGT
jgi:predicted nucleotidyltransferase